jgi:hypothetical protein
MEQAVKQRDLRLHASCGIRPHPFVVEPCLLHGLGADDGRRRPAIGELRDLHRG